MHMRKNPVSRFHMLMRSAFLSLVVLVILSNPLSAQEKKDERLANLPDFTRLVKNVGPAVVNISTVRNQKIGGTTRPDSWEKFHGQGPFDDLLRKFFRDRKPEKNNEDDDLDTIPKSSLGSGFIISPDGFIITNHHVIRGADKIIVRLSDRRVFEAKPIGSDKRSDIALIKIKASGLPVVRIGNSGSLEVGEWVVAIGSPFGFDHSVTAGVVSAKGRSLPNENYVPFIQTDVAINPGNSGGPLFNLKGEVVGVNSQIFSRTGGYMGLSFAIPIKVAMNVVDQLKTRGKVERGWLGVYIQDVTRELAESFGLDRPKGALVSRVIKGGPADKAGILEGDIITELDGREIQYSTQLPPMVGQLTANTAVELKLIRDGKEKMLKVTIGRLAEKVAVQSGSKSTVEPDLIDRLRIRIKALTADQKKKHGLGEQGVLVTEVQDGPAEAAGMQKDDIILKINRIEITSAESLKKVVRDLKKNVPVAILVYRNGSSMFLPLKLPE